MKLQSEFKPVSAKEWEEKILKDLKLTSIEELITHTSEGIDIRPFYNKEHISNINIHPYFNHIDWEITQFIPTQHHTEREINENIVKSLNGGSSGIHIDFYTKFDFDEIFTNISLPHIYSNINISFDALDIFKHLKEIYLSINEFTQKKNCFINIDPIYLFEKFGEWHNNKDTDFEVLHELNHIPVNAILYKESGANVVQELAYTLAHLNEYLLYLDNKKILSKYKDVHIQVSIGNSYFKEISKLRALRALVNHLLNEYHHTSNVHIHAQTTLLNKSFKDIYNNIIRTTTEAMSAIFGGANSISILPFDYPFKKVSDFSLRMARNQLIMMKEESYLNKTAETTLSNYFVEKFTQELIEKSYQKFLDIEKKNGLITLLEQNIIQQEIQKSCETELQKYINNQSVLIGVNKYPNPKDENIEKFYYQTSFDSTKTNALIPKRFAEYFEKQIQQV
jgi:methylmalonyl-CoA mutase